MNTSYLNECTVKNRDTFIRWWNNLLIDYGVVTVCDVKDMLGMTTLFSDTKSGWTMPINRKNFITMREITLLGVEIEYKLNLPNASLID